MAAGLSGNVLILQIAASRAALAFAVHGNAVALGDALLPDGCRCTASSTLWLTSTDGQLRPAASKRRIATRSVNGAARVAARCRDLAV